MIKLVSQFFAKIVLGAVCFLVLAPFYVSDTFGAQRNQCHEEILKYCQAVRPGRGAVLSCLGKHETELSQGCRAKFNRVKVRRMACRDDVEKFCRNVSSGAGALRDCLGRHENELSMSCRDVRSPASSRQSLPNTR